MRDDIIECNCIERTRIHMRRINGCWEWGISVKWIMFSLRKWQLAVDRQKNLGLYKIYLFNAACNRTCRWGWRVVEYKAVAKVSGCTWEDNAAMFVVRDVRTGTGSPWICPSFVLRCAYWHKCFVKEAFELLDYLGTIWSFQPSPEIRTPNVRPGQGLFQDTCQGWRV